MKRIVPFLLLLFLVSCSHPPPPGFQPYGATASRKTPPAATPRPTTAPSPGPAAALESGEATVATNPPTAAIVPAPAEATSEPAPPAAAAEQYTNRPAPPAGSEEVLPAGMINFPATDLNQVLQVYAELVNRTVLRPANLPAPLITLKTQTPLTKREAIAAFDAVLGMNGITMINVGDKFVKAVPSAQAGTAGAPPDPRTAAQLPELGPYVTHVIQLKYVKPSEIVAALQPFAQIPNSILPIDSSQILVLRDYTENVKRMLEMVKRIDVAVPSEYISEVIPIKYAKAVDIADALNSLSTGGGSTSIGRSSAGGASRGRGSSIMPGMNRPGSMNMGGYNTPGSTMFTPQSTSDTVTPQSVGDVFSPQSVDDVFTPQQAAPAAPAPPGAAGSFTQRLRNIIKNASAGSGTEIQILGQTKIIADERSNSLLIFATRQDMDIIKNIVSKLDVVLAQVLIETIIMDVSISDSMALGLSAVQTPTDFGGGKAAAGGMNAQQFFNFTQNATGDTNVFSDLLGTGLRYFGKVDNNYYLQLQAAASDGRVNVIQEPRILTSHATPGQIFIGNTVPYITSTYYGGGYGGPSSSYQQLSVGIGLTVTPYINPEGLVLMQIDESIDEISGSTDITGVGAVPNTTSRRLSAEIAVPDGDAVILGGFIRNASTKNNSGVPFLKDIPLLGSLFSSKASSKQRNELLVLMRPTVLKTPDLAVEATQNEKARMPGILKAEAEVNADQEKRVKQQQKEMQLQQKNNPNRAMTAAPGPQPPVNSNSPAASMPHP